MRSVQSLKNLLAPDAKARKVASGFIRVEGPVWIPRLRSLRWSDLPRNRIFEYAPATKKISIYRGSDNFVSGRNLDCDGDVVQCSHGNRRIERNHNGQVERLADHYNGAHLNSPHNLVVTRNGNTWFTDPSFGIYIADEGHPGVQEYADSYVFRFDPRTERLIPVITDIEEPSGLAFSPDEGTLYVTDASAYLRTDGTGNRHIRAYDVKNGRCKNGRIFRAFEEGAPLGIRVDVGGNIWACHSGGVEIISPEGKSLGKIELPEPVSDLCFGGEDGSDLYLCATSSIYHILTRTTDAARKTFSASETQ